jgi:hypothetical protein
MDLMGVVNMQHSQLIESAAAKADRFAPVHAGAHKHFVKIGYLHTGNKVRGGITTSHYFKRSTGGNSREVVVHGDGSYGKTSRRATGTRKSRGAIDAKGREMRAETKPAMGGDEKQAHGTEKPSATVGVSAHFKKHHPHGQTHSPKKQLGKKAATPNKKHHFDADGKPDAAAHTKFAEKHDNAATKAWDKGDKVSARKHLSAKEAHTRAAAALESGAKLGPMLSARAMSLSKDLWGK